MGFIRKISGADAARRASEVQADAGRDAIDVLREEYGLARKDLQPFVDVAQESLGQLSDFDASKSGLTENDPLYQQIEDFQFQDRLAGIRDFDPVNDNPLADAAANEAMRRVEERRASRGKLGAGGTTVDLFNATALTRAGLADQEFGRRATVAGMETGQEVQDFNQLLKAAALRSGLETDKFNQIMQTSSLAANAASGQANINTSLGTQVAGATQGIGNALAGGIVSASNLQRGFWNDVIKTGASLATGMPTGGGGAGGWADLAADAGVS